MSAIADDPAELEDNPEPAEQDEHETDELEPGDELEHDEHEHEEHQARGDAITAEEVERRNKQLDRLESYIGRKLTEIFGQETADALEVCELCAWTRTFGWRFNTLPPEPVRDAVKAAIGLGTIDELKAYPAFETCETCGGLGNVKTGSQVTQFLFRTCPSCIGRGYSSALDEDAQRPPVGVSVAALANGNGDGAPPTPPDFDMFGTPAGHPDYGKLAQHREVPISTWSHNLDPGA